MEPQDFSKDLVIAVAGYGVSTKANLYENMDNYVFGSLAGREAEMIVPYHYVDIDGSMPKGVELFLKYANEGEFPYLAIVGKSGHKSISYAKDTLEIATEGAMPDPGSEGASFALETMFAELLKAHEDGKETVFVMLYDPENERDIDTIGIAKNYQWLRTLNLSQGMVDAFENYESTEDLLKREAVEKDFAEKKAVEDAERKAKEAAEAPPKAPRKRAAKKVAAKPLVAEDKPLTDDAPVGTSVEVAGIPFVKKNPNPFREPLPTSTISSDEEEIPDGLEDHPGGLEEFQARLDRDEPKDKTAPDNLRPVGSPTGRLVDWPAKSEETILVAKADLAELAQGVQMVINALTNMMGK